MNDFYIFAYQSRISFLKEWTSFGRALSFKEANRNSYCSLFSSPGRSPGRAIVLPPVSVLALALALALAEVSALAKSLTFFFFLCDGQGAVR